MKAKDKIKPRQPAVEAGSYLATCVGVYGIGEQPKQYKDQKTVSYEEQIVFMFELSGQEYERDGEMAPVMLSTWGMKFTASQNGKLRKFLKSWGKDFSSDADFGEFEMFSMLGASAMLGVEVSESGYNNINSIMPLPKGMPDPSPTVALQSFDVSEWDEHTPFEELPEWIQNKIKESTQYQKQHAPADKVDFPKEDEEEAGEDDEDPEEDEPEPEPKPKAKTKAKVAPF